jgi:hypothetical protein
MINTTDHENASTYLHEGTEHHNTADHHWSAIPPSHLPSTPLENPINTDTTSSASTVAFVQGTIGDPNYALSPITRPHSSAIEFSRVLAVLSPSATQDFDWELKTHESQGLNKTKSK